MNWISLPGGPAIDGGSGCPGLISVVHNPDIFRRDKAVNSFDRLPRSESSPDNLQHLPSGGFHGSGARNGSPAAGEDHGVNIRVNQELWMLRGCFIGRFESPEEFFKALRPEGRSFPAWYFFYIVPLDPPEGAGLRGTLRSTIYLVTSRMECNPSTPLHFPLCPPLPRCLPARFEFILEKHIRKSEDPWEAHQHLRRSEENLFPWYAGTLILWQLIH